MDSPAPQEAVDSVSERRLVARFLRLRDERSFRSLYRLHSPLLYRVILRAFYEFRPGLEESLTQAIANLELLRDMKRSSGARYPIVTLHPVVTNITFARSKGISR